jgi:hypothetical protein
MAEESKKQSNIKQEYNVASKGLNLDNSQNNIDKGVLTYALNAAMENFDANSFQYQNEPGNVACFDFPDGFKLLGKYFIPEKSKIIFWLKNDVTGESELGYMVNNDCIYKTLINDNCLNFDTNRPILSGAHRILDNGDVEIYWADNNGRRYLNIEDIPYFPISTSDACDPTDSELLDCNALLLQPNLSIPITSASDVISGGEITNGTYQFTVQYADADGNPYTAYYNVTNPMPIADIDTATVNFDIPVGKSVIVNVNNLDPLGTYEYFNLSVIKTVNNIPSVELVGTYFIDSPSKQIIYTGQNKTNIRLTINDIFEKFAFYEGADYVTAVQDILVWKGVKPTQRISYQKIANDITLKWQTYRIPASDGGYANEVNAGNLRGYLRDEVYAFEVVFLLENGKETDAFHIPGRAAGPEELSNADIEITNSDYIGDGKNPSKYWEVYNTAEVEQFNDEFSNNVVEQTITIEYCTYELRQTSSVVFGRRFTIEYTDLDGVISTLTVNQRIQYVDSITVPTITVGTGLVSEVRCDEQVNTTVTNNSSEYKGPYQYGSFAYWESTEEYPCDESVWGDLAGEKIRHHKFPDCRVSPIIENSSFDGVPIIEDVAIFPIGVKIDTEEIQNLITVSDLTDQQKSDIVGYKITRADRGVNKSIVAKGMLRNVGKYNKEGQDFYYPNYPYNDLKPDVFINELNNALLEQCETFIVEIFDLTDEDDDGKAIMKVEYTNCITALTDVETYDSVGSFELCSIGKPRFISPGVRNKVNYHCWSWDDSAAPSPTNDTVGNISYASYDIYEVGRAKSYGVRIDWESIYEGDQSEWFNGAFDNKQCNWRIHVIKGTIPVQTDGRKSLIRLQDEIDGPSCFSDDTSIPIDTDSLNRQIFNSPETSFGQPFLGSILSLETVMYGGGRGHFVEVKDNAKYRLITKEAQEDALKAAEEVADLTQSFNLEAMFAVYNAQLTIFRNEITRRNFARSFNSTASYNYAKPVPKNLGIKNRNLDIKRYLIPEVLNVGEDDVNVNNYNRETSVYLRATEAIPVPDETLEVYHNVTIKDDSRFTISDVNNCSAPEKEEPISVVSYYGALKNRFVNQYGQIYSYESIDTGFIKVFSNEGLSEDIVWGGDTFIGRFAYKTKLPFFIDNRVNFPDDSDIFYDEIGNVGYPKYWHSSRSVLETWQGERKQDLKLTNFISYKATSFDCPNNQDIQEGTDPSTNPNRTFYDGYFYMFAYGVPSFYCESSYNLDLRTAFNNKEGDFWPHVSSGIPDEWVQETNVPIVQDNTYNYNVTFSKQNKESVITNIPANWDKDNEIDFYPFRAVYSDKQISNVNNRLNNWLIYRPTSYFDFPQNYGNLTALDSLKNAAILARFENKSFLYNSLVTIDTSNPQAAYVGNPNLFANQPIDFADTDQGYMGSQNKFILKTPYGAVSIDAKRGQVFLINGSQAQDLTQFGSGMQRWFTAHLPFEITKYFPGVDTDNHFKSVGLHGVFDSNYERIIITKLDYIPLNENIVFKDDKFYLVENGLEKEVFLIDTDYFCNVSWTISFNFNSKSWISFHSYLPNWYVGENNFFYSGLNYCPNDFDVLVGVKDLVIPTTTTTTTIPLTTTTSTTIYIAPPDCTFDAVITLPTCTLEGGGVFVGDPIIPPCERLSGLTSDTLYSGYDYLSTPYDTTTTKELACTALGYYYLIETLPDLLMTTINIEYDVIDLDGQIYLDNGTTDCTTVADGWYFTGQFGETNESVFRVASGVIVEISSCVENTTTTTSTTTVIPTDSYCYIGVYTNPDPIHPLGGVVTYEDEFGDDITVAGIWDDGEVTINAVSIISTSGVAPCTVITTTTTTTTEVPSYSIQLIPNCRYNNCNDNSTCAVDYEIVAESYPLGAYYTLVTNSGTAVVSLIDDTAVSGILRYSESDGFGTVNFTLTLRDSGGNALSSLTITMSHQSFWQFLPLC